MPLPLFQHHIQRPSPHVHRVGFSTSLTRLPIGSLALRPALLLFGNLRPRVTTAPLPHATGAYGQLPGRDFNPLDLLLLLRTDKTFYVRLVRGAAYGVNDFVDNGDSTISDRATGQMWTKGDSGKGMNWQEALAWAQAKNAESYLGHSDWRLPNTKELQAIVDYTRSPDTTSSAAINPLFTCTAITNEAGKQDYPFYWTNTTHLSSDGTGASAIYIAFGRAMGYMTSPTDSTRSAWVDVHGAGAQRSDPKAGNPADFPQGRGPQGDAIRIYNYVRLVRGIMRLTLHLGSISIALHGATIAL